MSAPPDGSSNRAGIRLDSWKQIAAHVNRHITTVRRWEKHEGLPVHRHVHSALSSVYAYASELDAWMNSRQPEESLGSPVFEMPVAGVVRRRHVPLPPSLTSVLCTQVALLGRDSEIETLWKVWRAALAGRQQIALITSEAGGGKTRLAFEFARSAAPEATLLTGVCDREALFPFAPFVTMLRWLVRTGDPSTLQGLLNEIAGSDELAQLVPEITKGMLRTAPEIEATAESRRFRMFDAFAQLLVALSRACPMLLLFEDVHWADGGSLLFLRHLIRSTKGAALCILMTYRENEPDSGSFSEEILHDLQREFAATRIRLSGLATDHVHCFVDSWTDHSATPQLKDWIAATTEGNPLFMTEMLTHLAETGGVDGKLAAAASTHLGLPEGIRYVIRRRFARLSPASKKLLTLGAVIGREFSLPLIEMLLDMPEDEVLDGIEEALAAKVVSEIPGATERFSFTHALIRETLYGDTMAARRARLHHRVGMALERQSLETLPLPELAYHFGEGAIYDTEKAIEYAVRAGDRAHNGLALEEAARHFGTALRTLCLLPPGPVRDGKRIELHILRGRSFLQACQWASAKTEFEAALSLVNPAERVKQCELLVQIAEASFWLMDVPALRRFASEAEFLADAVGRDDLWADARAWTASARVADGDVLGGIATDRRTLARSGGIRSFALARVPLTLYWAGHTAEAASRAEQAVEGARASGEPAFLLYALQHLGICLSGCGRYDEALQTFAEACTFGRQCGPSSLLARATSMSVTPLFNLGDFVAATNRAMEARELARRVAFEPALVSAGIDLLLIFARTHDPGRAEPLLVEVQRAVDKAGGWHAWKWKMRLCQARAELALSRGEWSRAITFASDVIEQSNSRHRPKYQALALTVRARALRELGLRKAVDDARASVDVARRLAEPVLLAECLSVLLLDKGTDELLAESQRAVDNVLLGVADQSLRRSFLAKMSATGQGQRSRKLSAAAVRNYA